MGEMESAASRKAFGRFCSCSPGLSPRPPSLGPGNVDPLTGRGKGTLYLLVCPLQPGVGWTVLLTASPRRLELGALVRLLIEPRRATAVQEPDTVGSQFWPHDRGHYPKLLKENFPKEQIASFRANRSCLWVF